MYAEIKPKINFKPIMKRTGAVDTPVIDVKQGTRRAQHHATATLTPGLHPAGRRDACQLLPPLLPDLGPLPHSVMRMLSWWKINSGYTLLEKGWRLTEPRRDAST